MFSVFGTSGALFRGPMEDLVRVAGVLPASSVRRTDAFLAHLDDAERRSHVDGWGKPDDGKPRAQPPVRSRPGMQATGEYARFQRAPAPARRVLNLVGDVMTAQVVVVGSDQTIRQGWQVLVDADVGQAPVVGPSGELVGLFSRAELLRLERLPSSDQGAVAWQAWLNEPLVRIMTSPVPAVYPQTDLRRLAHVLLLANLAGLPVLDAQDRLAGFVSRNDVLKAVAHDPPLDCWS